MDETHPTFACACELPPPAHTPIFDESEYERKLRHVERPFLDISTEKNVENASTVETHPNFAGVLPWHHVACQKNMKAFHGFARGNTYFRDVTPDRHLWFVL